MRINTRIFAIFIALLALFAVGIAYSGSAFATHTEATRDIYVSDKPGYKGWSTIHPPGYTVDHCIPICRDMQPVPVKVWKWNYPGWVSISIMQNTQVYAYPWTTSWVWGWTAKTGWFAVSPKQLLIKAGIPDCELTGVCPIR